MSGKILFDYQIFYNYYYNINSEYSNLNNLINLATRLSSQIVNFKKSLSTQIINSLQNQLQQTQQDIQSIQHNFQRNGVYIDKNPSNITYINEDAKKLNRPFILPKMLSNIYIQHSNIRIYIEINNNKHEIFFYIPRINNFGIQMGDHFHIGLDVQTNNVFLHWSYQVYDHQNNDYTRNMYAKCNFSNNNEDLSNIEDIICTNRISTMIGEFGAKYSRELGANTMNDPFQLKLLPIIKHILRRPFYPINIAGGRALHQRILTPNNKIKTSKYITKSGIKYNIYVGPRGGHYIKVNNKYKLVHNK